MALTLREIIQAPNRYVSTGLNRVVCALIEARDGDVDLNLYGYFYDLDGDGAKALEARVASHIKSEEIWDDGDGRDGLDVVCLDGKPVAVVREEGYDSYEYKIEVVDLAALDEMVAAARALRKNKVQDLVEVDLDEDVSERLGVQPSNDDKPSIG